MADDQLETLSLEDCLALLRMHSVGRVAVIENGFPIVLPINYKLVETSGPAWVALRARPGGVIDHAPIPVAFEIDHIDTAEHEGWSVLVRGTLHHVSPEAGGFGERFDPQPWLDNERDAWLIIEPFSISGRRLHAAQPQWTFHVRGYL